MQNNTIKMRKTTVSKPLSSWLTVQTIKPRSFESKRSKSVQKQRIVHGTEDPKENQKTVSRERSHQNHLPMQGKFLQLNQLPQLQFTKQVSKKQSSVKLKGKGSPEYKPGRAPVRAFQETAIPVKIRTLEDKTLNDTDSPLKLDTSMGQLDSIETIEVSQANLRKSMSVLATLKDIVRSSKNLGFQGYSPEKSSSQRTTEASTMRSPIPRQSFRIKSYSSLGMRSPRDSNIFEESALIPEISHQKDLIKSFIQNKYHFPTENKANELRSLNRTFSAQIMKSAGKNPLEIAKLKRKLDGAEKSRSKSAVMIKVERRRQGFMEIDAYNDLTEVAANFPPNFSIDQDIMKLTVGEVLPTEQSSHIKNSPQSKKIRIAIKLIQPKANLKPEFEEDYFDTNEAYQIKISTDDKKLLHRPTPLYMPNLSLITVEGNRKSKWKIIRERLWYALRKINALNLSPQILLEKKGVFSVSSYTRLSSRYLFKAVRDGNLSIVEIFLLRDKYLVYEFDHIFMTGLHWATKFGHFEIAKVLIAYHSDIEARDMIGRTPLYYALESKNIELMKLLLKVGCEPWSTKDYSIKKFMDNDEMVKYYFRKTRLLHLTMKMMKKSQRQAFWNSNTQFLLEPYPGYR